LKLSFRKKIKVGGIHLNLSKSGLGISTGIKGLHVGINSSGKTYLSGGAHGLYYRSNIGSTRSFINDSQTGIFHQKQVAEILNVDKNSNDGTTFWFIIGIIFFFFGFVFHLLFVPASVLIAAFINKRIKRRRSIQHDKYIFNTILKIKELVNDHRISSLKEKLQEVNNQLCNIFADDRMKGKNDLIQIYVATYKYVLEKIFEDKEICDEEIEIIRIFEQQISSSQYRDINSEIIDSLVVDILSDFCITEDEFAFINKVFEVLSISTEKKTEVLHKLEEMTRIECLRKNGLKPLDLKKDFLADKECYYNGKVELLKIRKCKGSQYYAMDTNADLFVCKNSIDFVSDGYKSIRLDKIAKVELKKDILEMTIVNRQTPICLKSEDSALVIAVIGELKNVLTSGVADARKDLGTTGSRGERS
jgi:hypothetical protein